MLNCPVCQSKTTVYDSREVNGAVWRRRRCAASHRFSTRETVYELSDDERRAILRANGKRSRGPMTNKKPIKILAYLQNPWFKPGNDPRLIERYNVDQDFHRRVLAGSATGRALVKALGEELYGKIIWDNASTVHGTTRDHVSPPDPAYMKRRFLEERPSVVLLFGQQARNGWSGVSLSGHRPVVLTAPHPMARGSQVDHLAEISAQLREMTA